MIMLDEHTTQKNGGNIRIAYLIAAHDNPSHLYRLTRSILSEDAKIFIHICRKSNIKDFVNVKHKNIFFIDNRIKCYWGDYSIVEAILSLMNTASRDQKPFEYYVLLSGTSYPLQTASYIESFIAKNRGKELINIVKMPNESAGKPLSRLTNYNVYQGERWLNKALSLSKPEKSLKELNYKYFLGQLKPYGGTTWWALSHRACQYILKFVQEERRVVNFYKNIFAADELLFHTIIGNSPFSQNVAGNIMYQDWSEFGANPAFIKENHLELLQANQRVITEDSYGTREVLFARKFSDNSSDIVDKIDKIIAERCI